jgi:hypothetical protein
VHIPLEDVFGEKHAAGGNKNAMLGAAVANLVSTVAALIVDDCL